MHHGAVEGTVLETLCPALLFELWVYVVSSLPLLPLQPSQNPLTSLPVSSALSLTLPPLEAQLLSHVGTSITVLVMKLLSSEGLPVPISISPYHSHTLEPVFPKTLATSQSLN